MHSRSSGYGADAGKTLTDRVRIRRQDFIYEGTANSNMMIRRYERKSEFGKAALWRETAAKCLDTISIPLAEITVVS